jgi:hypothetical protein
MRPRAGAIAVQDTTDEPLEGVDWSAAWETAAATHLFATVRAVCGVPPAVPEPLTADVIEQARIEAREILERAGEFGEGGADRDDDRGDDDDGGDDDAWLSEGWKRAAEEYHHQRGSRPNEVAYTSKELERLLRLLDLPLEHAWIETNHPWRADGRAAEAAVEALMYGLRARGTAALEEPAVRRRLSELSKQQLAEVGDRLMRLKPKIARAWSPDEVKALAQTYRTLKCG